jgi:hypothetical protein
MVYFRTPWEVVNGMSWARQRGHGAVTPYLRRVGVPRSTAYRWDQEFRWLLEFGGAELRRLRSECERLSVAAAGRANEVATRTTMSRERERALILEAAVSGTSDEDIVRLLARGLGRSLSHETVNAVIAEAGRRARAVFERYFAGAGRVGAADEIFLGRSPLLLVVEPLSLLISGLRLAEHCGAEDWGPVFARMEDLERCACDGGRGVNRAARDAGLDLQADLFHGLRDAEAWLGRFERTCEKRLAAEREALGKLEAARHQPGKYQTNGPTRRYQRACAQAERVLAEWCRLSDLFAQARRAFDLVAPEGRLNTASAAQAALAAALAAMELTEEGRALAATLRQVQDPRFFAHLDALAGSLRALSLEQVGPEREARLARLVAETVAWRRRDKDPVALLRQAATESLADEVELAVIEAVDRAVRSSSAVECVNSRVRLVQVARKRLGEDFLYLLAVYHNLHEFGRGSVREGRTPAELAGIKLPTSDWIGLLDLTANEPPAASGSAAVPGVPSTAPASAQNTA